MQDHTARSRFALKEKQVQGRFVFTCELRVKRWLTMVELECVALDASVIKGTLGFQLWCINRTISHHIESVTKLRAFSKKYFKLIVLGKQGFRDTTIENFCKGVLGLFLSVISVLIVDSRTPFPARLKRPLHRWR